MVDDIAIIAKNGKDLFCEDRNIFQLRFEQHSPMDIIDAQWITSRLTGQRGERIALARALGVTPDVVTKILKGSRRVQASEIPTILKFFGAEQAVSQADVEQQLIEKIAELTDEEKALLLGAADGLLSHRQGAKR